MSPPPRHQHQNQHHHLLSGETFLHCFKSFFDWYLVIFRLKNKILIKNKRLKPEVEKVELDQFWKGEFSIGECILYFNNKKRSLEVKPDQKNKWKESESETLENYLPDETEEPKEDAEGGQALLKKEDPVAGTVGQLTFSLIFISISFNISICPNKFSQNIERCGCMYW